MTDHNDIIYSFRLLLKILENVEAKYLNFEIRFYIINLNHAI
jgi:hypothetical protein